MRLTEAGAIKVFSDIRSGKTMERPGLEALLAYARKGDTLSVVRLRRLGRSLGELLTTVATLKERGIALLSLEERIDTNSAAGELVFHVFGAIAHFERRPIRRANKGRARRRAGVGESRPIANRGRQAARLGAIAKSVAPVSHGSMLGLIYGWRGKRTAVSNSEAKLWISALNVRERDCSWQRRLNR
jgi:DNA invertase Pin-like site-specific DNA recombinase